MSDVGERRKSARLYYICMHAPARFLPRKARAGHPSLDARNITLEVYYSVRVISSALALLFLLLCRGRREKLPEREIAT